MRVSELIQDLRFDTYEVRPVVEEQTSDGSAICHPFDTVSEAETFIVEMTVGTDGWPPEGYRMLWSIYGHHDGNGVQALFDADSENEAFGLLFSISGITGTTGQIVYKLP
ncbi:hypothetical protein [Tunturiibacter gelidiferens]|uniref:hypothetical protein n=1 Tax=Tunturiibacter gelidiferens TaxID=3069689 RepID=UPI003D9BDE3C